MKSKQKSIAVLSVVSNPFCHCFEPSSFHQMVEEIVN